MQGIIALLLVAGDGKNFAQEAMMYYFLLFRTVGYQRIECYKNIHGEFHLRSP